MPFDGIRNSALVRTLADVLEDLPDLFQKEMRLAQAEFTDIVQMTRYYMIEAARCGIRLSPTWAGFPV
jgi:hypothetical protein